MKWFKTFTLVFILIIFAAQNVKTESTISPLINSTVQEKNEVVNVTENTIIPVENVSIPVKVTTEEISPAPCNSSHSHLVESTTEKYQKDSDTTVWLGLIFIGFLFFAPSVICICGCCFVIWYILRKRNREKNAKARENNPSQVESNPVQPNNLTSARSATASRTSAGPSARSEVSVKSKAESGNSNLEKKNL